MTLLLLKIFMAGGVLATVYRIYYTIIQDHEKAVENKQSDKITKDLGKVTEDAKHVQVSQSTFDAAVDKFNRDNK